MIDSFRVYKHRTALKPSNVNAADTEFAILITSTATNLTKSSKLYFGTPSLDFHIEKVRDSLTFSGMKCLSYSSSLEKGSSHDLWRRMDPEGGPDSFCWEPSTPLTFLPIRYGGKYLRLIDYPIFRYTRLTCSGLMDDPIGLAVTNILEILTGWRLVFCEGAPTVSLNSGIASRQRRMENTLVMVLARETDSNEDIQLLVRAPSSNAEANSHAWMSVSRKLKFPPLGMNEMPYTVLGVSALVSPIPY